jgi:hypothetical protein
LRDSGFKNDQLEQLGKSLEPNTSAVVSKKDTARNFGHRSAVLAALMRLAGIDPAC